MIDTTCNENNPSDCKIIYYVGNEFKYLTVQKDFQGNASIVEATVNWLTDPKLSDLTIDFLAGVNITSRCEKDYSEVYCKKATAVLPLATMKSLRQEEDYYFWINIRAIGEVSRSLYANLVEVAVCLEGTNPTKHAAILQFSQVTNYPGPINTTGPMELCFPENDADVIALKVYFKGIVFLARLIAFIFAHDSFGKMHREEGTSLNVTWSIEPNSCKWLDVKQYVIDPQTFVLIIRFIILNAETAERLNYEEFDIDMCSIRFLVVRVCNHIICEKHCSCLHQQQQKIEFNVSIRVLDTNDPLEVHTEVKNSSCELRVTDEDAAGSSFNTLDRVCFEPASDGIQCSGCRQKPDVWLHANGPKATIGLETEQGNWCQQKICLVQALVFVVDDKSKIPVLCNMSYHPGLRSSISQTNLPKQRIAQPKGSYNSTCPTMRSTALQTTIAPISFLYSIGQSGKLLTLLIYTFSYCLLML